MYEYYTASVQRQVTSKGTRSSSGIVIIKSPAHGTGSSARKKVFMMSTIVVARYVLVQNIKISKYQNIERVLLRTYLVMC